MQLHDGAQAVAIEGAQTIAIVGSEAITYDEVMAGAKVWLDNNKDRVPDHKLQAAIREQMQKRLKPHIETMLVYCDARNTIPEEHFPRIEENIAKHFETHVVKKLMKNTKAGSRRELDEKMHQAGTSLAREKKAFIKRSLAQQWGHEQTKSDQEIAYDEMMEYYRGHLSDFEHPARARWEELLVRFSKYPSNAEAKAAIVELGNMVIAGAPFADVARRFSGGTTAEEGGQRDWTSKGVLVSEELDRAIFGLPVGQLSQIIKTDSGFHIIRVIERTEAGRTPFVDAQVEIREKIRQQRTLQAQNDYVNRLKKDIPVWTIFDEEGGQERISGRPGYPRR